MAVALLSSVNSQTADSTLGSGRDSLRPDVQLPAIGGGGGSPFTARCPQGEILTGFDIWAGDWTDAVSPVCISSKKGQYKAYPQRFGGPGGKGPFRTVCPENTPALLSMYLVARGRNDITVEEIYLYCGQAVTAPQQVSKYSARFKGASTYNYDGYGNTAYPKEIDGTQSCPTGLVAVGMSGRTGELVDAIGLICGDPRTFGITVDANAVDAGARVRLPGGSTGPSIPICEAARQAKARNSPAAPGLQNQCDFERASLDLEGLRLKGIEITMNEPEYKEAMLLQREITSQIGFQIGLGAADGQTQLGPGKQRIHDALPPEAQEGFNAAVTYSLLRNRRKIDDLAAKGFLLSTGSPLTTSLRNKLGENKARRGFDIGLAVVEGNGALPPEIAKIRGNLTPEEQKGFDAAISFSATRDKERTADAAGDLVPRGKILTSEDPLAVEYRRQQPNAEAQRGFEIGMAAAEGQTLPGPGKDKIRGSLRVSEQVGFDAAVAFSLERNRNADLAKVGGYIASKDKDVSNLRKSENDVFFRLGVDIASGIFGDRKLGAKGNTQTGPGSLKIRDSLSPAGQRGFNAAVTLHLSKKY